MQEPDSKTPREMWRVREILGPNDHAIPSVVELYVETFPKNERVPARTLVSVLTRPEPDFEAPTARHHMLVAESERGVVGFRLFGYYPRSGLGYFIYVAVAPESRRQGIGEALVEVAKHQCYIDAISQNTDLAAIVFECEDPKLAVSEQDRDVRERRLAYFMKRGGRIVSTSYVQPAVSSTEEPVPMILLAYPVQDAWNPRQYVAGFYQEVFGLSPDAEYIQRSFSGIPGAED